MYNGIITVNNKIVVFVNLKSYTMSGRGDNNKNGTSGRGASNQSNQPFAGQEKVHKSNRGEQTGGKASEDQPRQQDQDSNRNTSTDGKKAKR